MDEDTIYIEVQISDEDIKALYLYEPLSQDTFDKKVFRRPVNILIRRKSDATSIRGSSEE
jgi:hypothetical protein